MITYYFCFCMVKIVIVSRHNFCLIACKLDFAFMIAYTMLFIMSLLHFKNLF